MPRTHSTSRVLSIAAACALALSLLAGCSSGSSPSTTGPIAVETPAAPAVVDFRETEPGSGAGLRLGLVSADEGVPVNNQISTGIKEQADVAGAELTICDAAGQASGALDCVKKFQTLGLDGYFLYQLNTSAAQSICDAGPDVPVIGISFPQKPCESANLGVDNLYAGFLGGQAVGNYFAGEKNCQYDAYVSLELSALGDANQQRMDGYRRGLESVCGQIHNDRVLDVSSPDDARSQFRDVLTSMPDAHSIIVVGVGDYAVLGAKAAAENSDRAQDVYFSGQGADPSSLCSIANDPNWIADVAYFPERWGEVAVPSMLDLIAGETVPEALTTPSVVVDAANIGDYYSLADC